MRGFIKNGKTLLSGVDPVRRAERTADSLRITDRTLYFCPSPLYGYGIDRLLSRIEEESPGSAVLCVEADPELYELAVNSIPAARNGKLHITNVCDSLRLIALVRAIWGERAFRRTETVRFTGGWQLSPELYNSLCKELEREFASEWSNALTIIKLGRLYIRNALRNLSLVTRRKSIADISFGKSPVLVLGAGPSLDETLDLLEKHFSCDLAECEKRFFKIICADTCLGSLNERKITPDIAVILESQHWNMRDFSGCRGWKVNAAADLSSYPASTRMLGGQCFLFFTPWTELKILKRLKDAELLPAIVPPLGSVGLSAVEIARSLTGGKIICAGMDFSFSQDRTHARGTPSHRSMLKNQSRLRGILSAAAFGESSVSAVSKSGFPVYSNPIMRNYRDLFEQEFGGDPRIFDIEGSGLPLGVKTLSRNEFVNLLHREEDAQRGIEARKKTEDSSSFLCLKEEKLKRFLEEERNRLEEMRGILTGDIAADNERLKILVDECDYLWAHFPDCAGKRPDTQNTSFLKRVRTEIDSFIALQRLILQS